MRFLNGIVVGFLLAIAVAYMHDRTAPVDADGSRREIVNWDEFGRAAADAAGWVRGRFARLDAEFRHPR